MMSCRQFALLSCLTEAMPLPRAVLFDNDGLLLDTETAWTAAEKEIFRRRGVEFTDAHKQELLGTSAERAAELLLGYFGDHSDPEEILAERDAVVLAELENGVEEMLGAREILNRLRQEGVPIGLVSNSTMQFATRALELAGLDGFFDAMVSGHEVAAPKPAPDPYLEACRLLGVEPGPEVFALEDSPTGVTSARAAGLTVIGIPSIDGILLEEADKIAASLTDQLVHGLLGLNSKP